MLFYRNKEFLIKKCKKKLVMIYDKDLLIIKTVYYRIIILFCENIAALLKFEGTGF